MRNFNLLAKLALVFALLVGLNSCDKEEGGDKGVVDDTKTLVGAWSQDYDDFDYQGSIKVTFDKNGAYEIEDEYTSEEFGDEWSLEKGTYTVEGSILGLTENSYENSDGDKSEREDNDSSYSFFEIDGDLLTIYNIKSSDFVPNTSYESVEDIKADGYKVASPELYKRK